MSKRDPYDVLEVHPSAELAEIKKAYRRLAKRYHPDAAGDPASARRFIEIQRAYEAIVKRRGENSAGAYGADAARSGFEYDVDFGDGDPSTGRQQAAGTRPGADADFETRGEPSWRGYVRDTWNWLVAELWSLILIALCVVPLIGAWFLARWIGMRWFIFLVAAWLLILAIIRPDQWQRD